VFTVEFMENVHWLIRTRGIEEARRQAITKRERQVVEAAYQVLSDDEERIGFSYSGFALTSLPHKPTNDLSWKRDGHKLTLLLQSGLDRNQTPIGLPYGSYARFMLLFLQSQAVKTRSRDIELGGSMRAWLGTLGLSVGGKTYRLVSEQARRISHCRLTFFLNHGRDEVFKHGAFVEGAIHFSENDDQPSLWKDRVRLDEGFYRALLDHPVPMSESALKAIGPRSMVIDIYIWLAYRLHALKNQIEVGWPALHSQFGAGFGQVRNFRVHFLLALELALAAYPDALVTPGERGLVLHPSRPAVAGA
jgi:Plasmid encoded RepA protein